MYLSSATLKIPSFLCTVLSITVSLQLHSQDKKSSLSKPSSTFSPLKVKHRHRAVSIKKTVPAKDSVRSLKRTIVAGLLGTFGKDTSGISKDSVSGAIKALPGKDSIGRLALEKLGYDSAVMNRDSLLRQLRHQPAQQFKNVVAPFKDQFKKPEAKTLKKKLSTLLPYELEDPSTIAQVGGGYIQYNYMFRSALDTPFVESNLGQHMITAGLDFAVADIPFRLTYYGRQSNSQYLPILLTLPLAISSLN